MTRELCALTVAEMVCSGSAESIGAGASKQANVDTQGREGSETPVLVAHG